MIRKMKTRNNVKDLNPLNSFIIMVFMFSYEKKKNKKSFSSILSPLRCLLTLHRQRLLNRLSGLGFNIQHRDKVCEKQQQYSTTKWLLRIGGTFQMCHTVRMILNESYSESNDWMKLNGSKMKRTPTKLNWIYSLLRLIVKGNPHHSLTNNFLNTIQFVF